MTDRETKREDWEGFLKEFQDESDRAAAIVGAAFLDEQLRYLLEEFLADAPESRALLAGPLRGFAVRAKTAFSLGFVSQLEYRDIERIGNVRNAFAHQLHGRTFDDADIADLCDALELPSKISSWPMPSRDKYVMSVHQLATWFALRRLAIRADRRRINPGPSYPERG